MLPEATDEFVAKFPDDFTERLKELGEQGFWDWVYARIHYYAHHPNAHKWRALTEELRKAWLKDVKAVPIANKRVRLGDLQRQYNRLETMALGELPAEDLVDVQKEQRGTLDQAAEEVGEKITKQESKVEERGTKTVIIETKMPNYAEMANASTEPGETQ